MMSRGASVPSLRYMKTGVTVDSFWYMKTGVTVENGRASNATSVYEGVLVLVVCVVI